MRKLLCVAAIAAMLVSLTAVPGFSWDNTSHISLAPNGKGDMLIYPVYVATGNWKTKFTVTNTDRNRICVARIGFYSKKYTQEVRDFYLFLSPADVWTGTVEINPANGNVRIFSDDDSCLTGLTGTAPALTGTFASPAAPYVSDFAAVKCAGDTNQFGYAIVYQQWSEAGNAPGVLKQAILTKDQQFKLAAAANFGKGLAKEATNILSGSYEVINASSGLYASGTPTVLKDFDNNFFYDYTEVLDIGRAFDRSNNSVGELEAALSVRDIAMKYYNAAAKKSMHFFTFPTKGTDAEGKRCNCTQMIGPFFKSAGFLQNCAVPYNLAYYDLTEKTEQGPAGFESPQPGPVKDVFPDELNWTAPYVNPEDNWKTNFTEGWANYDFINAANTVITYPQISRVAGRELRYTNSAPVIALEVSWTDYGLTINPAAYSFKTWNTATNSWDHIVDYNLPADAPDGGYLEYPLYQIYNPSDSNDGIPGIFN